MHCKQFMQFKLYACRKFRFRVESVLSRLEMGQIASKFGLPDAKTGLSSVSIRQVGTRFLANNAGRVHSKSEKLLVPATLPLMTAYVAIPHIARRGNTFPEQWFFSLRYRNPKKKD